MKRALAGGALLLASIATVAGCFTTNHITQAAPAPAAPAARAALPPPVSRLLEAFSRHDVEAMVREAHPEIEWYLVEAGKIEREVRGHDELRRSMSTYFATTPGVRSSVTSDVALNGRFVSFQERVRWTKKDGSEGTQASIAVYELEGERVRRAWYFPSEP